MKKSLVLFLVLLSFYTLSHGKGVSADSAKIVGYHYLLQHGNHTLANADELQLVYTSGASPAYFYVLSGNSCFVIVSADDGITPVLGYANDQAFDGNNMPSNVSGFLQGYGKKINYAIANHIVATTEIEQQWDGLVNNTHSSERTTKTTSVSPLLSTTWNQCPGYNALCPYDAAATCGTNAPTGCVATAMVQIMKYWGWPMQGAGSNSYTSAYGVLSANFSATTYNWAAMPLNTYSPGIDTLMYEAGVSVNMDYGPTGSSAYSFGGSSPSAQNALINNFCYKSSMQGMIRSSYTDAVWLSTILNELNLGRPVLYGGYGSLGGHGWVVDGYDASNNFHCNWGWGGTDNGYYNMDTLVPGPTANGTFDSSENALIGIQPNIPIILISGSPKVCLGYQIMLASDSATGVWSSSNASIASVSASGSVTGLSMGTAVISYGVTGCGTQYAIDTITITNDYIPVITGNMSVCVAATTGLSDSATGGTWSSSGIASGTVNPATGIVTGLSAGAASIIYTLPTGCMATTTVTVKPLPSAGTITGLASVCIGSTVSLTDGVSGGVWSSSTISVATTGSSTGIVTGVSSGIATIDYSVTNSCGMAIATSTVTTVPLPNAGTINGAASVCTGLTVTLNDAGSTGSSAWSSSNTGVATVTGAGVVTGVSAGSANISYTVTNSCGTANTEKVINVSSCTTGSNNISGQAEDISIYPNPAQNNITIAASSAIKTVVINNLVGQKVFSGIYNSNNIVIGLEQLPAGMYLVKINDYKIYNVVKQ